MPGRSAELVVPSMSAVIVSSGTVATPVTHSSGSGLGSRSDGEYSMVTCPSVACKPGQRSLKESVRSWTVGLLSLSKVNSAKRGSSGSRSRDEAPKGLHAAVSATTAPSVTIKRRGVFTEAGLPGRRGNSGRRCGLIASRLQGWGRRKQIGRGPENASLSGPRLCDEAAQCGM